MRASSAIHYDSCYWLDLPEVSAMWQWIINHGKVVERIGFLFSVNLLADTTEEYFSNEVLMKIISEDHKIN